MRRRRFIGVAVAICLLTVTTPSMASASSTAQTGRLPERYVVSSEPGVLPEGIGVGRHGTFYVTSSATGAVYQGSVRDPQMRLFAPAGDAGRRSALGVHTDKAGRVFVAGTSALDVYSPSGRLLAHRPAPAGPVGEASLNDLVVTDDAVYVTDFANPTVFRAELHGDRVGPLLPWLDTRPVETRLPAQYWFLNGIVASADERTLLVSSQGLEQVIRVDIAGRAADVVDLGPTTFAADGLVLRGTTLYAVLNYDPPAGQGVYVAQLEPTLHSGRVVASTTTGFDSPTTVALDKHRILVVNSQFDHRPGTPPYTVSTVALALSDGLPRPE